MGRKIINKRKKVAFFDFPGHPFVHDLSKELSTEKKYTLYHLYNPEQLGPKSNFNKKSFEKIIPISKSFSRNFYIRFFDEIIYSFKCIYHISKINPDVLIASSMPLIPLYFLTLLKKFMSFKLIFWMQDIQSIAIDKILTRKKNVIAGLVTKLFHFFETTIIKSSDSIILITEDFKKYFKSEMSNKNVYTIHNWGSFENIKPLEKLNSFSIEKKISDTFNILYSGTLGYKHNPDILLGLSTFLQNKDLNVKIIIVSEGPVVNYLKEKTKELKINNILFLPFQRFEIFPEVLASCEASLVLLEEDSSDFCVPSKFLSILCSKRIPIVNTSSNNLVSKIIIENECGLIVNDQRSLNMKVEKLVNNYSKFRHLADNGYSYASKNFKINHISNIFNNIIKELHS